MSKYKFKSEVSQLLHLIIHSLYSHKEIFLRELISNASDALDKLKYLTLTDDAYKSFQKDFRIDLACEGEEKLVVQDNGIGMNKEELQKNLGTIARSGTKEFLSQMSEQKKDLQSELIGQFGVGFYSAFMVAEKVEVVSKKAGEDEAWRWVSAGEGNFSVDPAEKEQHGTKITLFLNKEGKEYASKWQLESLVKKYSNHVPFPIFLEEVKKDGEDAEITQLNTASALWRRNKSEISDEEYEEFYKGLDGDLEKPLFHLHTQAEGALEYTTLFYVPSRAPFDLFSAEYRSGVKLYIKRVFISDDKRELLPPYLRFVRGVIDSEDLPLNVSREMIQDNRVMHSIRNASVKKLLSEFERISKEDPDMYTRFIDFYNKPLKEGLYTDFGNKDKIVSLIRFKSSHAEGYVSLAEYVSRMNSEQKAVYYLSGDSEKNLRASPLVASYRARSIEVLLLCDEVDEVIVPMIGKYEEFELKPINKVGSDADLKQESDTTKEEEASPLVKRIKKALGDKVKDVVASALLAETPCCVIWDSDDPSRRMQQIMAAMGQNRDEEVKPVLEVNPSHLIIEKLASLKDDDEFLNIVLLLFEGALLVEGTLPSDSAGFVQRLNTVLEKTF